jgi:hypothetical protein
MNSVKYCFLDERPIERFVDIFGYLGLVNRTYLCTTDVGKSLLLSKKIKRFALLADVFRVRPLTAPRGPPPAPPGADSAAPGPRSG